MRNVYLTCFFLLASALFAVSQVGGAAPPGPFQRYSVSGIVVDVNNRPVDQAQVTLGDPETNYQAPSVMTNSQGQFIFPDVTASRYLIQAFRGNLKSDPGYITAGPGAGPFKLVVK